ncbi:MAG: hypothetical protein GY716_01360 [bacterium]|nr:hypothetical protein [bacterium]
MFLQPRAWLDSQPSVRFVALAALLYLMLYPAWIAMGPAYGHIVAEAYVVVAPALEHPTRTIAATPNGDATVLSTTKDYPSFSVANKNLFIDLPVLIALILALPRRPWPMRLKMMTIGAGVLLTVHLVAFATAVHISHAQSDLSRFETVPGWFTLYVVSSLRRLLYSDAILAIPFLTFGVLALLYRPDSKRKRRQQ